VKINPMKKILCLPISIAIILTFANHASAQNRPDRFSAERKAIERLFSAWNSNEPEKVVAAFSGDVMYEDVAAAKINRGSDEVRKWVVGAFADIENFKLEVVRSTFYKNGGVVEWIWSGTDTGLFKTGRSFSVRGVSVIEVRSGEVSSYKEYYDFSAVMRQLGLLPSDKKSAGVRRRLDNRFFAPKVRPHLARGGVRGAPGPDGPDSASRNGAE
jgi:steroid delta-isomerase-like uncharacterized protein